MIVEILGVLKRHSHASMRYIDFHTAVSEPAGVSGIVIIQHGVEIVGAVETSGPPALIGQVGVIVIAVEVLPVIVDIERAGRCRSTRLADTNR